MTEKYRLVAIGVISQAFKNLLDLDASSGLGVEDNSCVLAFDETAVMVLEGRSNLIHDDFKKYFSTQIKAVSKNTYLHEEFLEDLKLLQAEYCM